MKAKRGLAASTTKKKSGPPPTPINWGILDSILQYGATIIDAVELLGCSEDSIRRSIMREHGISFTESRDLKLAKLRQKLKA